MSWAMISTNMVDLMGNYASRSSWPCTKQIPEGVSYLLVCWNWEWNFVIRCIQSSNGLDVALLLLAICIHDIESARKQKIGPVRTKEEYSHKIHSSECLFQLGQCTTSSKVKRRELKVFEGGSKVERLTTYIHSMGAKPIQSVI
jgi:hypothetical protein